MLGYVGKKVDGSYAPFHWNISLASQDVEISDGIFVIQRELAEAYQAAKINPTPDVVVGFYRNGQHRHTCLYGRLAIGHWRGFRSPRMKWRRPAPKVDELLHEGALCLPQPPA